MFKQKRNMQHPVETNLYRDVFNQRDRYRGKRKKPISKKRMLTYSGMTILACHLSVSAVITLIWHTLASIPLLSNLDKVSAGSPFLDFIHFIFFLHPMDVNLIELFFTFIASALAIYYESLSWHIVNIQRDPKSLNHHEGDSRIRQPEELSALPWTSIFPDAGAHSKGVSPTMVISHLMINNHGLKHIMIPKRYTRTTVVTNEYGDKEIKHKGAPILDANGNRIYKRVPIINNKYSQALFDASGIPHNKNMRYIYDPTKLQFNPNGNIRGKNPNAKTVADQINSDWYFPSYEVEPPGGMYIVDTDPDNTMVLAMTRAGKGQTVIEPTIDMWLRSDKKCNIVINDPKGELYVEFAYPATIRGFNVIAFNLINPLRTNVYNPLGYAVEASRQGDTQKVEQYVNDIGDVFFPVGKNSGDPFWQHAANAAFKRSALGLIDYYQDEDTEIRRRAEVIAEENRKKISDAKHDYAYAGRTLDLSIKFTRDPDFKNRTVKSAKKIYKQYHKYYQKAVSNYSRDIYRTHMIKAEKHLDFIRDAMNTPETLRLSMDEALKHYQDLMKDSSVVNNTTVDPSILNNRLDKLWGHVTLYNVYQMMTQLASKKSDDAGDSNGTISRNKAKQAANSFNQSADKGSQQSSKQKGKSDLISDTKKDMLAIASKLGGEKGDPSKFNKDIKKLKKDNKIINKKHLSTDDIFDWLINKKGYTQVHYKNSNTYEKTSHGTFRLDENGHLIPKKIISSVTKPGSLGLIAFSTDEQKLLAQQKKQGLSGAKDYLTLFFDAEKHLPQNSLRASVANEDNSLRAMAGSEKTIASVYGIALTAVKFFSDRRISRLTSGRPSQNFDMAGLGFPRRIMIRFSDKYLDRYSFNGSKFVWHAYYDPNFTKPYKGVDFTHSGNIDPHGWASFIFKGIFKNKTTYLRLDLLSPTNLLSHTFYFAFTKGYQQTVNGLGFIRNPITHHLIIHNGIIREMQPKDYHKNGEHYRTFVYGNTKFDNYRYNLIKDTKHLVKSNAVTQVNIHYSEKPRVVFFITPPHLTSYAKIILILLNQMFNRQVSMSYVTKANQKPLYMTRYMLDEVGNLRSEGKGIPFLQTKESIGLGQDQQYTLILQTLQQLRDIYGQSIDKILQGNTRNIIYLKSTDDSMLDTLQKMGGTRHNTYIDSRNFTRDIGQSAKPHNTHMQISYSQNVKRVPVISKNWMLDIPRSSSMIFGHGYPIVSQRQTCLPMSWRLLKNQLNEKQVTGKSYSLLSVPTTSNTADFDVLQNQPNFFKMTKKRVKQAKLSMRMMPMYEKVHGIKTEDDLAKVNHDDMAKEILANVNQVLWHQQRVKKYNHELAIEKGRRANRQAIQQAKLHDEKVKKLKKQRDKAEETLNEDGAEDAAIASQDYSDSNTTDNAPVINAEKSADKATNAHKKKIYANNTLSKGDLLNYEGKAVISTNSDMKSIIATAYGESIAEFAQDPKFIVRNGSLLLRQADGTTKVMIDCVDDKKSSAYKQSRAISQNQGHVSDPNAKLATAKSKYNVTDDFVYYLAGLPNWDDIANGAFDSNMALTFAKNESPN